LAGQVEGHGARPVLLDRPRKSVRHLIDRALPRRAQERVVGLSQHWMKQTSPEPKRFAERCAFRAQPSEIGRMVRVTFDRRTALPIRLGQHAAPDPAIRAGRAHGQRVVREHIHQ
jgi:hypothetical protein